MAPSWKLGTFLHSCFALMQKSAKFSLWSHKKFRTKKVLLLFCSRNNYFKLVTSLGILSIVLEERFFHISFCLVLWFSVQTQILQKFVLDTCSKRFTSTNLDFGILILFQNICIGFGTLWPWSYRTFIGFGWILRELLARILISKYPIFWHFKRLDLRSI